MICEKCRRKFPGLALGPFGIVCQECMRLVVSEDPPLYEKLLAEHVLDLPLFLDIDDFERAMLKLSVHFLKSATPDQAIRLRNQNVYLMYPRPMALQLKDQVLEMIPLMYVSSMPAEGRNNVFCTGTYQFKKPLPKEVLVKAMVKAKLVKVEGEDLA